MNLPRLVEAMARALALIGGAALIVIIGVTVVSVVGRALIFVGLGPIPGDFEIVEALTGFAVFCFLPYCQLVRRPRHRRRLHQLHGPAPPCAGSTRWPKSLLPRWCSR